MRSWLWVGALPLYLWGYAWTSVAVAAPGDLLVAEYEAGSVLEFGQGGDLSKAERFATGLSLPIGICVGPGGEIYVAETGTGEITIITEGGDFSGAEPFAVGGVSIAALYCDDEVLLVTVIGPPPDKGEPPNGSIWDASDGGMFIFTGAVYASQMALPGGFARTDDGTFYNGNGDIWDITKGGAFGAIPPFTTGRVLVSLAEREGLLLGGDFVLPEIVDFGAGGDMILAPIYATLPDVGSGVHGLLDGGEAGLFALMADEIFDISGGGDFSAAVPYATGLQTGQLGFHGMVHHICSTDADCFDGDACNGAERCEDNACLPPAEPLSCDDENVCTVDDCAPGSGCENEPIAGCCSSDEHCAFDEFCDGSTNTCVPVTAVTGEGGDDPADGTGGGDTENSTGEGQAEGSGTAGSETDGAGLEGEGEGCGCHSTPSPRGLWGMLLLLALDRRRRMYQRSGRAPGK